MKKLTIILSVMLLPAWIHAQQRINVPGDYPSIQEAVDAAAYGDTVLVAQGTYQENIIIQGNDKIITLASNFILSGDTTDIDNTIIDAGNPTNPNYGMGVLIKNQVPSGRAEPDQTVVKGFTIINGTGYYKTYGGGIYVNKATPSIEYNYISDCYVTGIQPSGGGIRVSNTMGDTSVACFIKHNRISNCIVEANETNGDAGTGAGISLESVNAVVEDNDIIGNELIGYTGTDFWFCGAGISYEYHDSSSLHPQVTIQNNFIADNSITAPRCAGGGIYGYVNYDPFWSIYLVKFIIKGNTISNNQINSVNGRGAGIYLNSPRDGSAISGNDIIENTIEEGAGLKYGGGIFYTMNTQIEENQEILIERNKIIGNVADHGGGVYIYYALATFVNNFISSNTAFTRAGAIYYRGPQNGNPAVGIINNTITNNISGIYCGGMTLYGHFNLLLMNNIFWGNEAANMNEIEITNDSVVIYNCDINPSTITGDYGGKYNFYDDPEFLENGMTWDCLNPGPCWNAGIIGVYAFGQTFSAPDECIGGNERPTDTLVDVGACEVGLCVGLDELAVNGQESTVSVFPNPTCGIVDCQFGIADCRRVTLMIYDLTGRQMAMVLDKEMSAGEHTIHYDASALPPGIYLLKMHSGTDVKDVKLIKQ